ncbi:MAG: GatB/YqeY domain-containing protein [Firmicutes bacterium]|nr:GatB/YqeY domain-containing protein [Bacillota bacterium]
MTLIERLNQDMKTAMKTKDKTALSVIRMVRSTLKNQEIDQKCPLSEEEALHLISKERKKLKDSLQEFEQAGREDLAEKVREEIAILEKYLPEQLSDGELKEMVRETVQETGASSKADIGKVMKAIMPKVKGRADGKRVNRMVQEELS